LDLQARGDGHRAVEADAGQRIEGFAQRIVEDALHIHGAQGNGAALLLDVAQLLAEEDEVAVLLAQRHMHVVQHLVDGFFDRPSCEGAVTEGCIRLATFCTDTGRLPRICSTATDLAMS
jgi:hypothetical protein